jgi:hypothetical protein
VRLEIRRERSASGAFTCDRLVSRGFEQWNRGAQDPVIGDEIVAVQVGDMGAADEPVRSLSQRRLDEPDLEAKLVRSTGVAD